jgi:radical SAM protein with 4Fe4S-binding SPASM domain
MRPVQPNAYVASRESIAWQFRPEKVLANPAIVDRARGRSSKYFPVATEVHPTSTCNLSCGHCSYRDRNGLKGQLTPSEVLGIIQWCDAVGVDSILFSGGGDPLAWPHWPTTLDLTSSWDLRPMLSLATNGIGIAEGFGREHYGRFSIIQVSVYGFDSASFLRITERDVFRRFVQSMNVLFANKPRHLQCTAKILIDDSNVDSWEAAVRFVLDWPFDAVVVKVGGRFEGERGIALSAGQVNRLSNGLREFCWPSYLAVAFNGLEGPSVKKATSSDERCLFVEFGLYLLVCSDGSVYPCVAAADDDSACLGSIRESTLSQLWLRRREVAERLHRKYASRRCRLEVCRHLNYNSIIAELGNILPQADGLRLPLL